MARTVADQCAEILAEAGIARVYGIVGDSLNGLTDSMRRQGRVAWVPTRHEEAAAFAAAGEAQTTGRLAACAGSCGPGNLHLINGLYDAHRSRVPVLAIAAQIPSAEIGSGYFQETRPEALFRECSHYCETIATPAQAARVLRTAIRTAIAKGGVAVVALPGDVALAPAVDGPAAKGEVVLAPSCAEPATGSVDRLAALLNGARRVTLLCGGGCAGAHAELLALADRLKSPIVHALRGKEHVEWDNPFDVGMTGLIGFASGYYAMTDCDALLMLGTDFPYPQFLPDPAKARVAQVDVRGEQIGKRADVEVAVVGDVGATLRALLPLVHDGRDDTHLRRATGHYRRTRQDLDALARPGARGLIHPQQVAATVSDLASDDAVLAADVGLPTVWAARYWQTNGRRRLLGSFWHGSMANALPQAIGAQAADPGRQVITFSGDGGLSMLLGELLTLRQLRLPVKVVVFNNGSLGFVELEQKATGFVDAGTTLDNPDFAALARAAGLHGIRAETPAEVGPALREALAHDGPVLVDAVVNRSELAMPPKVSAAMAKGFTLYMAKAVLSGRADEVVDLAATNLWR